MGKSESYQIKNDSKYFSGRNFYGRRQFYVTYCCITDNPKTSQLTTKHTYYLTDSVGQESRDILAGFSASGYLTIKVLSRTVVSCKGSAGEGPTSQLTVIVVGRIQHFVGSLAIDWRPPSVPNPMGLLNMTACLMKARTLRRQERRECYLDTSDSPLLPNLRCDIASLLARIT